MCSSDLHPLDFIARLVSLIPAPWMNLIRYFGGFAPACPCRDQIILDPGYRRKQQSLECLASGDEGVEKEISGNRYTWAQILKRVFGIDGSCPHCGGEMKTLGKIEACQQEVIIKILRHLGLDTDPPDLPREARFEPLEFPF